MSKTEYFKEVNYSLGDEDSLVEYELLENKSPKVGVIAGSGGRVIPLLAKFPVELHCIDILDGQIFLTELRLKAIQSFSYEDYLGFLGYPPYKFSPTKRKEYFYKLELSKAAAEYIEKMLSHAKWQPIIYLGNFERTLIRFSRIIRGVLGKEVISMFANDNLNKQKEYFKTRFPKRRWNVLVFILGNSAVLNSLLYKGEFPKKNITISAYRHYKNIFSNLFSSFLLKESFFLQLLFLGEMKYKEGNPIECEREVFDHAKEAIKSSKVILHTGNVLKDLPKSLSFLSISDVPSFFKPEEEVSYLDIISSYLAEDALLVTRAHLRMPVSVSDSMLNVTAIHEYLFKKERTQLWSFFIYKKRKNVYTEIL